MATLMMLTITWYRKQQLISDNKVTAIIWIIIGSPITFIVAVFFYGKNFKSTPVSSRALWKKIQDILYPFQNTVNSNCNFIYCLRHNLVCFLPGYERGTI